MIKELLDPKIIKYLLIGLLNTIITYTVIFVLLNTYSWKYFSATFLGYFLGFINSFLFNRSYTFRSKKPIKSTFWRFLLVFLICYSIASVFGFLGESLFDSGVRYSHNLAVVLGAMIYVPLGFLLNKKHVFNNEVCND